MDEDASRAYEEVCLDRYDKLSHLFLLPGFLKSRIMLSKFFFFFFFPCSWSAGALGRSAFGVAIGMPPWLLIVSQQCNDRTVMIVELW